MALTPGTRLGVYEVTSQIGAGGMGEVYRATDSNLKRSVAIKVLPASVASDADRLARFQREAEVLAALNHPNIGAIYGLEKTPDVTALIMELVEGDDLSRRIARGAIPLDEALPIAKQIAEALEAAHEQGIVHRDLKPANIKVRPDGAVKVLDFGLAKAIDPTSASGLDVTSSPTFAAHATQMGMVMGTAPYMAPEQARGKPVDKRADIWAFGAVLYEMLTGRRAFPGDEISDVLATVLKSDPDWTALPSDTPPAIRRLLTRCLQKDPKERLRDIGDARVDLGVPADDGSSEAASAFATLPAAKRSTMPWLAAAAAGIAAVAMLILWAPWRPKPASALPVRLSAELGADASLMLAGNGQAGAAAVLSPDGRLLAFVAQTTAGGKSQLFVRPLDGLEATRLAGTDDAASPFFSPDGQWIGFFADRRLKKIAVTGGPAATLCDSPNSRGGWWGDDGAIVFQPSGATAAALMRVPSAGGTPAPLTTLAAGELTHRWPQVLPGSRGMIFTVSTTIGNYSTNAAIVFQPLPAGPRKTLVQGGYFGRYLPGHLLYIHEGMLFAAPFNLDRLELTGPAVPVLEDVGVGVTNGSAQFAVSDTGRLVFATKETSISGRAPIAWLDRHGRTTLIHRAAIDWSNPQFSPDGQRLTLDVTDTKETDIWVFDWARDALSPLTLDPGEHWMPMWTPDGRRIAFRWAPPQGAPNVYWRRADGGGDVQQLTTGATSQYPFTWHPSGRTFAYGVPSSRGADVNLVSLDGSEESGWKPGSVTTFLSGQSNISAAFSPDGRWIAYSSNESGTYQVYVQSFPGPGGKWLVSVDGGTYPVWSRTKNELLFAGPDNRIKVVAYRTSADSFQPETPQSWSDVRFLPRPRGFGGLAGRPFDLHPDGERVIIAPYPEDGRLEKQDRLVFVLNFLDELKRIAPLAR